MYAKRYDFIVPTLEEMKLFDRGLVPITRNNGFNSAFPFYKNENGDREWLVEAEWGEIIVVDTEYCPNLQLTTALPLIYMVADAMDIPQLETDRELEIFHAPKDTAKVTKIFEAICEHCMRIHK